MNALDMLAQLRDNIGEATASYWTDLNLLRRLNLAQTRVGRLAQKSNGQWLVTSANVTPVASVITLPSDCARPVYLEETANNNPVAFASSVRYRASSRQSLSDLSNVVYREAYPLLATLEVNQSSYTTQCTLWYELRPPNLHCGTAKASSGASALEFDDAAESAGGTGRAIVFLDDYYNNSVVEVVDQTSGIVDIRSAISDFAASTHIATITGTVASGDTYGTISRLPEETHDLIVMEATVLALMKPSSVLDKEVLGFYLDELRRLRNDVSEWLASRSPGIDLPPRMAEM